MKAIVAVRGADEIEFLKSRAESVPWKPDTARDETRRMRENALSFWQYEAVQAHIQGTKLIVAYMHHADAALEFVTTNAWLDSFWAPGSEDARERMMIAHFATEAQATKFLYEKCLQGARICVVLGLASLDALLSRDLPLPPDRGGGTVRFEDASVDTLRDVMRALKENAAKAEKPETAEERVGRVRRHVRELLEHEPRYEALRPRVSWVDDDVEVSVRAKGRAMQALAAKFMDALSRKR